MDKKDNSARNERPRKSGPSEKRSARPKDGATTGRDRKPGGRPPRGPRSERAQGNHHGRSTRERSQGEHGGRDRGGRWDGVSAPKHRKRVVSAATGVAADAPEWLLQNNTQVKVSSATVTELVEAMGLSTQNDRIAHFVDHLLLVKELNQEINLVSRANVESVLLQSLWESLVPVLNDSWHRGERILDLGSGGGFPGLCLAIALPDYHFTLVDSRRAKTLALTSMVNEMGLKNVDVVHERAETLSEHDGRVFDTVVVRAVGLLKEVAPWASGLLRPGGTLLAWKGPEGLREMTALNHDEWKLAETLPVLPHRSVFVLEHKGVAGASGEAS